MSLFDEQGATESDYLNGPGFTGKDVQPTTFQGLTAMTPVKGAIAGAEEGIGILAHGVPSLIHNVLQSGAYMGAAEQGSDSEEAVQGAQDFEKPWMPKVEETADVINQTARAQAKDLMPDPRVSGTGTNMIFGFPKVATQAAGALLTRNPALAATVFGYMQGMGNYQDLKDQGVDDATAQKAATLQGLLAGGSMFVPAGLPAKWLSEMAPATAAVTQIATGASVNVASGMASRYLTSELLEKAGYPELAAQNKVLDGSAMVADMLSGAFFGGAHFFTGHVQELADTARTAAENGNLDPAVRDAAKVAQDNRQATVDRAPGVPVDAESAGAHAQALEKALSDVLSDKPVDVSQELDDSHEFIQRPEDPDVTSHIRDLIHEEFKSAGVMSEASKVDQLDKVVEGMYQGKPVPPYEGEVRVPRGTDEADTTGVPAAEAQQSLKESQEADETPKMIDLAAKCAGMTA